MPNIVEWSIYILLSLLGFALIWFFPKQFGISEKNEKYFKLGYAIKVFGGACFVLAYFLYFKVGDTFLYNQGSNYLANLFWENPVEYFKLIFSSPDQAQEISPGLIYEVNYSRESSVEEWFMVRILSVISILSFQSYLIATFIISLISFIGSWSFYKFFTRTFNNSTHIAFISSFLMPSVFFWASGMLKDTFVFSFLGLMIFYFSKLFSDSKSKLILNLIYAIFFGFLAYKIKSYVIILLFPCILYFLSAKFKRNIENYLLRNLISPLLIIISLASAVFLAEFISNTTEKYQTDKLMQRAEGFHTTHSISGSYYSLGDMEYTPIGVLKKLPAAINVSLFRPYPWENSSIIVLVSSVESLFLMFLFIAILLKYRFRINYWTKRNSYFILFISFTLIFGAVVGYTSFNFGVLMRYKIPMMPFYVFTLLFYYQNRKSLN